MTWTFFSQGLCSENSRLISLRTKLYVLSLVLCGMFTMAKIVMFEQF